MGEPQRVGHPCGVKGEQVSRTDPRVSTSAGSSKDPPTTRKPYKLGAEEKRFLRDRTPGQVPRVSETSLKKEAFTPRLPGTEGPVSGVFRRSYSSTPTLR